MAGINSAMLFADDHANFEVSYNYTNGSLLEGGQKDVIKDNLTPSPDSFLITNYGVNTQLYLMPNLGIDITYTFSGKTKAESSQVTELLEVYEHQIFEIGVVARYFYDSFGSSYYSFFTGAGATYSVIDYTSDFRNLYPGIELYDLASEWGWYVKTGMKFHISKYLFVGVSAQYSFLNNEVENSGLNIDGKYLHIPMHFGISF